MSENLLVFEFEGVRWPRARITGITEIPGANQQPPPTLYYDLAPEGGGRRYRAHGPIGWWRDFIAMDLNDQAAVLAFLSRRGDPSGRMEQVALNAARQRFRQPPAEAPQPSTADWAGLSEPLASLVRAWTAPDGEGISRIDPARWDAADRLWRDHFAADWLEELALVPDPKGRRPFVLRVKTLAAYMVISAAASLYRRANMRTCAHCGSWFEFSKTHARFCSLSCRTLAHGSRRA
jgi:hypothetical protein